MNRRSMLGMSAFGLVAGAQAAALGGTSELSEPADVVVAGTRPLRFSAGDAGAVLSFVPTGSYRLEREFLVDAAYPAGTVESGRFVIRQGPFDHSLTYEYETETAALGLHRRVVADRMLATNGHVISMLRTSYGTHRRHYVSALDADRLEAVGDGVSGILGAHSALRHELKMNGETCEVREWARRDEDSPWIPIARSTWVPAA